METVFVLKNLGCVGSQKVFRRKEKKLKENDFLMFNCIMKIFKVKYK